MRISDWSSDVCSSDLNTRCVRSPSDGRNPLVLNRPLSGSTDLGEPSSDLARFVRQCHSPCRSFRLHGLARGARSELMFRQSSRYSNDVLILRSEEHTSELQSLMRISYAVFCLKKK